MRKVNIQNLLISKKPRPMEYASKVIELLEFDFERGLIVAKANEILNSIKNPDLDPKDIEIGILKTIYRNVNTEVQRDILELLEKIKENNELQKDKCLKYKSLCKILPLDLLIELIERVGSVERLAVINPGIIKNLDIIQRHPNYLKGGRNYNRFLANKIVLAARVDAYGDEEFCFNIEPLGTIKISKKEIKKTRRGGIKARTRRSKHSRKS